MIKTEISILLKWTAKPLTLHRVPEQEEHLMNYTKRSDTIRVAGATLQLPPPIFGQITEFGFLEKINFFFDLGGFDPSYGFGATGCQKKYSLGK